MPFKHLPISKIYIDQDVADFPQAISIPRQLPVPCEVVNNTQSLFERLSLADDPVKKGKEVLFLTRNKGPFVRKCPGTRFYTCCGYQILHIGTFCTMDCSYCILQSYFHPPLLSYFINHQDLLAELDRTFSENTVRRIGTGEFTDSLIWDPLTHLSGLLVPKFSKQSHAILELKTKTTAIESLEKLTHNRKTIVSWSLNTDKVIRDEERDTASLSERLRAAAKCESWGYPLAFHFDPMVIYDGCEEDYRRVVEKLFSCVSADNIVWISLGAFRYIPTLKSIIQRRFSDSKIIYGEFITGLDGKMRYFKPLRLDLYRKMISWIKGVAPNVFIYFCMEDDEVWNRSFGFIPSKRGGLSRLLDKAAVRYCGLDD